MKALKLDYGNIQVIGDAQVIIVPSGWVGQYHVITEDPTEGDWHYEHEFLSKDQLYEKYDYKE